MHSFQIIGALFGAGLFLIIFLLLRAGRLREKYSLLWLFISLLIMVISLARGVLEWLAGLAGVEYAPSALFAMLLGALFLLLLNVSVSISGIRKHNRTLAQKTALLALKMEQATREAGGRQLESPQQPPPPPPPPPPSSSQQEESNP